MFLSHGSIVTKTPISLTNYTSSWFPSMPPMSSSGWPSVYAGIYSQQLWVYVVVSKLAKAAARLPLPVYARGEMDRPRADDHPMAVLLRKPNPSLSWFDLMLWTSSTFDIYGDTAWLKQRKGGVVTALYPLHPSAMTHDNGSWTFDNGKTILRNIDDGDLVWFRQFHPDSHIRGLSPLEPLRSTLENEWSARAATSSFWVNGARPGMALTHPGTLSEPAQQRLKAQVDAATGGAGKTGSTLILEEGMEPKVMTLTAEEAQYIETRKLNREEVCAAYDIPPPVVHILDHATFSNITEQMRSMYRDTMAPRLKGFEAAIEIGLRQAEWPNDDVYAEFLMDEVLRGDFEARQDALAKASHMTIAEKRKVENLPFIEGTDRIFMNAAEQPMAAAQNNDAPAAPPFAQVGLPALVDAGVISRDDARALLGIAGAAPDAPDVIAPPVPLTVVRSVLGRLSWQTSLSDVDEKAITEGLKPAHAAKVSRALREEIAVAGTVPDLRRRLAGMIGKAAIKAPNLDDHQAAISRVLSSFFESQGSAVLRSGSFDMDRWNDQLADDLHAVAVTVSGVIGKGAVRELGFNPSLYDVDRTVAFLRAVAVRLASTINETTRDQYRDADDPAAVFAAAAASRSDGIAGGVSATVAGFAVIEAGRRIAESEGVSPTKTWVTGTNPRPEHAALDGASVPIDEPFPNGDDWPGGLPGCNCTVEVSY